MLFPMWGKQKSEVSEMNIGSFPLDDSSAHFFEEIQFLSVQHALQTRVLLMQHPSSKTNDKHSVWGFSVEERHCALFCSSCLYHCNNVASLLPVDCIFDFCYDKCNSGVIHLKPQPLLHPLAKLVIVSWRLLPPHLIILLSGCSCGDNCERHSIEK